MVIDDIEIIITRKSIKNLYIRVKKDGKVYVNVPRKALSKEIDQLINDNIEWIKTKLDQTKTHQAPVELDYKTGEIHYLWGKPYTLDVKEVATRKDISVKNNVIRLSITENSSREEREILLYSLYRNELSRIIPDLLTYWESIMKVKVSEWRLKKMKTRWGTCNTKVKRIWFNVELAKFPFKSMEYVLVHELVHLLEASHNSRFKTLMTHFLPDWKEQKKTLKNHF